MENLIKQSEQLLMELDALIEKDYQEALNLIELFREETLAFREQNEISYLEFTESLSNFDSNYYETAI
jgi:hypothetical protein